MKELRGMVSGSRSFFLSKDHHPLENDLGPGFIPPSSKVEALLEYQIHQSEALNLGLYFKLKTAIIAIPLLSAHSSLLMPSLASYATIQSSPHLIIPPLLIQSDTLHKSVSYDTTKLAEIAFCISDKNVDNMMFDLTSKCCLSRYECSHCGSNIQISLVAWGRRIGKQRIKVGHKVTGDVMYAFRISAQGYNAE
ncbi:hypothetical protein VNO78_20110 [Psophocarpus tetragonolobus]|uniref:Uncharacterized protein n=1 Tax=Psophocarpus tetragonolobus TaxID=3891 RepID=A0AAN9S9B2_PSOTE